MRVTNNAIYFWGGIYSQWYKSSFTYQGINFATAEQWMMYHKAKLFNDQDVMKKVLETSDPKKQKALGRQVKNFSEARWNERKLEIVIQGNILKFSQNEVLKKDILASRTKTLVEASPVDRIWGIGLAPDDERVLNPHAWQGQNLLGEALMQARERVSAGEDGLNWEL